ncbi:MAG: hypothetical protein K2X39_06170, partial [Silvanigrellaceae bacterium]|nr:hypothetical protein [Silvanigrellaceae bacterium]
GHPLERGSTFSCALLAELLEASIPYPATNQALEIAMASALQSSIERMKSKFEKNPEESRLEDILNEETFVPSFQGSTSSQDIYEGETGEDDIQDVHDENKEKAQQDQERDRSYLRITSG